MPQDELVESAQADIARIPLLPDLYSPLRESGALRDAIEPVTRPEISTVSADGTHVASPSAMSEVTDNHSIEIDPFDLTNKVAAAAKRMADIPVEKLKDPTVVRQVWGGFLDDLLGSRKIAQA